MLRERARFALVILAAVSGGCSLRSIVNDPLPPVARSYVSKRFSVAELRAELADVVAIVEESEATPYMFRSRREVAERLRSLQDEIKRPLTRYEFLPSLLELRAAFRIAHGTVPFPIEEFNDFVERGGRLPSFAAQRDGDKIVITRTEPTIGFRVGDELLAINGLDAGALVDRVRAAIPDDLNPPFGDDVLHRRFGQWLWAFGVVGPFHLKLKRGELVYELTEVGLRPERMLTIRERFLSSSQPGSALPFSVKVLPNKVAVLDVRSFNPLDRERWDAFLDTTFVRLKRERVRGLVIDLRENGGGDTRAGDALLRYVTDRPYRNFGGKLWRRSERYDAFFRAAIPWWLRWLPYERWIVSSSFAEIKHGETRWFPAEPETPKPTPLRFRGAVAVLTGPRTFSAAASFADAVRTYQLATLVGEPPGGLNGVAGEIALTRLPRTRLAIAICSARFVRASGDARDLTPTPVDIAVARGAGDPQLERAIASVLERPASRPPAPPPTSP
jgi:Peptidase family S41